MKRLDRMKTAIRIQRAAEKKGYKVVDMAAALNVSQQSVYKIYDGTVLNLERLIEISQIVGTDLTDLIVLK